MSRALKNVGKKVIRQVLEAGQRYGVNLLPHHFYSPTPDFRALRADNHWKHPRSMIGVLGADVRGQLAFVEECAPAAMIERLKKGDVHKNACTANGEPGFGPIEADFLHAFIVAKRPAKIVQIGCGVSTSVALSAAREAGYVPDIVCVEPYPTKFLRDRASAGELRLVAEPAQNVALATLLDVGDAGLFFVDSTHTVKPGSEVNRIIFEVLPRLRRGTWVHFHDIYFPYDYTRGVLDDDLFFNNESALLLAFLTQNPAYEIRAALSMLHYAERDALARFMPNYNPAADDFGLRASDGHFPSSTYLQVRADSPFSPPA